MRLLRVMGSKVWIFGDYKQAESMIVAWRGPVPRLKEWFKTGKDVHVEVAKMMAKVVQEHKILLPNKLFAKVPWPDITKENSPDERQMAKTTGHANNYDLGKNTFALFTGLPVKYAEAIQLIYHAGLPEIKRGYQEWIRQEIRKSRTLTLPPPFTWSKTFYGIHNDDLLRAAYAFYPQSTVGCLLTQTIVRVSECFSKVNFDGGIVWTPERIRSCGLDGRINAHDAIGVSVPDDKESISFAVKTIAEASKETLQIAGDELTIPMDFQVGRSWGELKEWKEAA